MGWKICAAAFITLIFIFLQHFVDGLTNPDDVAAINNLYIAFGSPQIPGWTPSGGDPCTDAWQGVQCDASNIISISLIAANLGGELGDSLGSFSSLKSIDLSNNHIGGSIPSGLPVSLQTFLLSDNNFTGSIPSTISSLTNIVTLKINDNYLTGELPDAFQFFPALSSIDLGSNSLSGELPPSMQDLSALSSLHLQENQFSGKLDVLQNLPLQDLNIENNLFSGPLTDKLLSIPNFKRDGNPFNTAVAPMPSTSSPSGQPSPLSQLPPRSLTPSPPGQTSPLSLSPPRSGRRPANQEAPPSTQQEQNTQKKMQSLKTKRIVGISIASVLGFIILTLALLLCMPWCFSKSKKYYRDTKRPEFQPFMGARDRFLNTGSFSRPRNQIEDAKKDTRVGTMDTPRGDVMKTAAIPRQQNEPELDSQRSIIPLRKLDSELSLSEFDLIMPPPPPPPPLPTRPLPLLSGEKVIVKPTTSTEALAVKPSAKPLPSTSVKSFSIASLQQYTNSFSQDNLIGSGMLGSVYRAELPDGKLLAVKKLDKGVSSRQKDDEFIELVNNIDKIRHVNVVELAGFCAEHGQRLLIYEYCSNGTLQDALQADDEYRRQLSWTTRMRMALGAARALEYLHEDCEPPVVHRNFKSANILLDDELNVHVSDCGLAPLIASGSVNQLSGHILSTYGYGAPEFESGIYTMQSDVYSFGVMMLELLTGRMSYDRTRIRGEQFLVRWAVPQLHDIDALQRMVDPSLMKDYSTKSLSHFADIISRCVQSEPGFRPLMSEVVQDLQHILQRGSPAHSSFGGV